jgi:hypothetical protein
MNDILLTHGYFLAEDEKEQQIMKPYPPLGLLYLSAYLSIPLRYSTVHSLSVVNSSNDSQERLAARLAFTQTS